MAEYSTITLAGGIKASRDRLGDPGPAQAVSLAFTAFGQLVEALAEACAAEEFRLDHSSWDIAYPNPDVAAEDAANLALEAARARGSSGRIARRGHDLITRAIGRLRQLMDLLYGPVHDSAITSAP